MLIFWKNHYSIEIVFSENLEIRKFEFFCNRIQFDCDRQSRKKTLAELKNKNKTFGSVASAILVSLRF